MSLLLESEEYPRVFPKEVDFEKNAIEYINTVLAKHYGPSDIAHFYFIIARESGDFLEEYGAGNKITQETLTKMGFGMPGSLLAKARKIL